MAFPPSEAEPHMSNQVGLFCGHKPYFAILAQVKKQVVHAANRVYTKPSINIAVAKQKPIYKKPTPQAAKTNSSPLSQPHTDVIATGWLSHLYLPILIIFLFAGGLYLNTCWNRYAIDDTIVITDNKFTLQGFGGIHDLMTHDAFVGFFGDRGSKLVSGGRYRPLSIVTLAIEVEFFGMNPVVSHSVNVLLFALSCILIFIVLRRMIPPSRDAPFYLNLPFIATMLYAAHPIHTEAVANIKGRDEIMGMLLAMLTMYASLLYIRTQHILHLIWGTAVFFLALLSKENAITFMAVIPLTYYFFTHAKARDYAMTIGLYAIPVVLFLYMRHLYTAAGLTADSPEILNNPFAYLTHDMEGFSQRYATIIFTFLLYLKLLIFPHPLSHDYYFNQIPFIHFTDIGFITSLIVHIALIVYALRGIRTKALTSYAILFYIVTFSIVSNLFFTVGILMNERFVYMCSLGFCILLAWLILRVKHRFDLSPTVISSLTLVILLLYTVKTVSRNTVWMDNLTLFIVDAKAAPNSAKVNTSAGGDLTKLCHEDFKVMRANHELQRYCDLLNLDIQVDQLPDSIIKEKLMTQSIAHLNKALEVYPTHSNAWLLLGNATYQHSKQNVQASISCYEKAASYRVGGYYDAWYNIGCVQVENNMAAPAKENFIKALAIKPDIYECRYNLADAYSKLAMPDSAIYWYLKTIELKPQDAASYYKIGTIYGKQLGNLDAAITNISKAIDINGGVAQYYEDLAVAYGIKGDVDQSIKVAQEGIKKFPDYTGLYMNLSVSYRKKGNIEMADQLLAKAKNLMTGKS
jgi:protein O-mannosyl-transferase